MVAISSLLLTETCISGIGISKLMIQKPTFTDKSEQMNGFYFFTTPAADDEKNTC